MAAETTTETQARTQVRLGPDAAGSAASTWTRPIRQDVHDHEPGHRRGADDLRARRAGRRRPRGRRGAGRVRVGPWAEHEARRAPAHPVEARRSHARARRRARRRSRRSTTASRSSSRSHRRAAGGRSASTTSPAGRPSSPARRCRCRPGRSSPTRCASRSASSARSSRGTSRSCSPSWKVAPALAAGNTVVLKPAELTPLTALRSASWRSRPACPPACSTSCPASGSIAGEALVEHPGVAKIAFTGSTDGRQAHHAQPRPTR